MPPTSYDSGAAPAAVNLPRQALDVAIEAAHVADPIHTVDESESGNRLFMTVPKGFEIREITDPDRLGRFPRESITVDEKYSLAAYINRHSAPNSMILADIDAAQITGFLDWHHPNHTEDAGIPAHCSHRAVLALRLSEEFARWDAFEGKMRPQVEFAAFLEENAVDVCSPEAATMLEVARDLEATQGVIFKSSNRLESGDRAFVYETETKTKGDVKVPREFHLGIPIYYGEGPMILRAALRFQVTAGGLLLGFEWRRVEYQKQAQFREIATAVADATVVPVFFGRRGVK